MDIALKRRVSVFCNFLACAKKCREFNSTQNRTKIKLLPALSIMRGAFKPGNFASPPQVETNQIRGVPKERDKELELRHAGS